MQSAKTQNSFSMYSLMVKVNEGINNLAEIDIMSIVITISLVINIFSLKYWLDICAEYNLIDKT